MNSSFDRELQQRLAALREQGLRRELRRVDSAQSPRIEIGGRPLLNFSSNDYLGLAGDPALKTAAIHAVERYGAGSGAARLICGSLAPHHELEDALAHFKRTEAALSFSSGYATALGALGALLEKEDVVILDKRVHASIVDAAKLCGAKLRVFDHNNLNDLEAILRWADQSRNPKSDTRTRRRAVLIVTESVFSMDGDRAPLREIVGLKEQFGAWLMVDEAHATGLYGKGRRGLAEELGVEDQIEIHMGTLGKALGAGGGYLCGSRPLIDCLVNRARSFIFTTAPVPAAAAAAAAAVRFVQSAAGESRCRELWARIEQFQSEFKRHPPNAAGAIIPVILGHEDRAVEAANALREQGIFIPAIRYPTVARGAARLRVTLTAAHSAGDVSTLARALEPIVARDS